MTSVLLTIYDGSGNAQIVDLYANESIALNWRFTEIADFGVRGSFSRQFRIPASKTNVDFFGPLFNVNFSGSFSFHTKLDAVLTVDTIPIAHGHVQMQRVYIQRDAISDFELVFYAETPDLSRAIGDKKLKDLDYSSINHTIDFDHITTPTADYLWGLADRGQKWSELGEAGSRPVLNLDVPLYAGDFTPCVNWKWIFNKIITEAGFVYEGTELDTAMADYWMPYLNSRYVLTDTPAEANFFSLGYATNQTSVSLTFTPTLLTGLSEVYDNGNNVSGGVFTSPFTGYFTFIAWATVNTDTSGTIEYMYIELRPNDTTSDAYFQSVGFPCDGSDQNFNTPQFTIFLNSGDEVVMGLRVPGALSTTLYGDGNDNPETGTGWRLIGTSAALAGDDIDFALNAPDMLQIDFIRDTIKMHNLAVIPDRNVPNKIAFEPLTTYLGSGTSKDWTQKLDISKDIVISPTTEDQRRKLVFTHKAGSDAGSQLYVREGARVYGDYQVEGYTVSSTETPNEFAQGETRVELVTASTPCNAIGGTNIIIPKFIAENGDFVVPGPRCLYNSGTSEVAVYNDGAMSPAAEFVAVYLLNHYSDVFPGVADFDLNWAPETPLQFITANPTNNLFNLWWRDYLNEIYSENARYMEAYFALTLTDILTFAFSDKLFIKDAYWRILEITDYAVGKMDSTLVKLVKIVDVDIDCEFIPVSVTTGGIVNFEDGDGNASFGNELCCTRYGYSWDGTASRCRAFGGGKANVTLSGQGTNGIGYAVGTQSSAAFSMAMVSNGNIAPSSTFSYFGGTGIDVEGGNPNSIMVGDTLSLLGERRGAAVFGKNARVVHPGIHLGGGWYDDDRGDNLGRAQSGQIILIGEGDFTNNTTDVWMYVEGITSNYIELENRSSWSCIVTVNVHQFNAALGTITGNAWGLYGVDLYKSGGTAQIGTIYTIHANGTLGTLSLHCDTTTNTAQHRFSMRINGGNPHNNCFATASFIYTQVKS